MTRTRPAAAAALVAAILVAGCRGEETADNAVEAQEQNTVELAGTRYRVVLFRELNVHTAPDEALWNRPPPEHGHGLYMVVLRACGVSDGAARTSDEIHLEDAFGQRFAPRSAGTADKFEYTAAELEPGECLPGKGTVADRTFDGAVLVFDVPFDSAQERPMILEIGDPSGSGEARVQLDL